MAAGITSPPVDSELVLSTCSSLVSNFFVLPLLLRKFAARSLRFWPNTKEEEDALAPLEAASVSWTHSVAVGETDDVGRGFVSPSFVEDSLVNGIKFAALATGGCLFSSSALELEHTD